MRVANYTLNVSCELQVAYNVRVASYFSNEICELEIGKCELFERCELLTKVVSYQDSRSRFTKSCELPRLWNIAASRACMEKFSPWQPYRKGVSSLFRLFCTFRQAKEVFRTLFQEFRTKSFRTNPSCIYDIKKYMLKVQLHLCTG